MDRILEPEVMNADEDAREYDAMDHATVNNTFVTDLLAALTDWSLQRPVDEPLNILDLGAGTAQIPLDLARRAPHVHITAVDAAESMLAVARHNIATAGLADRITLLRADAKRLPFADGAFHVVISNSIAHHIPEPDTVMAEAIRVTARGGLMFHRDLARPADEPALQVLVNTYADTATPYGRHLFAESLHAALTAEEVADIVSSLGFNRAAVKMTSDRHWTWSATNHQS